jgi:hypothetical protein
MGSWLAAWVDDHVVLRNGDAGPPDAPSRRVFQSGRERRTQMLWLLLLILLVIAVGGGIVISKFLFLVLAVALLVAFFARGNLTH